MNAWKVVAVVYATRANASRILAAHGPAAAGLAVSLAWPRGNATGLATLFPELSAKRLDLLKEPVPRASRVAVLGNAANPAGMLALRQTDGAAHQMGIVPQGHEHRGLGS